MNYTICRRKSTKRDAGEGDIVITGGTVIVPGGEAGLTAENGKVTISGGAVREP